MRTIKVSGSTRFALVDDEDFEEVSRYRWHLAWNGRQVRSSLHKPTSPKATFIHRIVLGVKRGLETDHIDGDVFNNQKSNLRFCNRHQNQGNRRPQRTSLAPFKGISFDRSRSKWMARIAIYPNRSKFLGRFNKPEEAALAYDRAAVKVHGEFALTNEMLGLYAHRPVKKKLSRL